MYLKSIIFILLALLPFTLKANLMVYPMSVQVTADKQTNSTLKIMSKSDTTQYIRVVLKEVINPATPEEREQDVANWQGQGIVISPVKFALPAGSTKTVRVVALNAPEQERVYRAYFEPVSGDVTGKNSAKSVQAQVALTLVWGVLIRQLPDKPHIALQRVHPRPGITNTGNVRIRLRGYSQCPPHISDDKCTWKAIPQGIYPGASMALPDIERQKPLRIRYLTEDDKPLSLTLP
ncbi:hypothetical protein HA48_00310 [Pantoea wallisii]|uniref:Fimbrial protein n=1 Tax=Pantoea wallisii TaxID=1076551 RepID=A0A1X1DER2_9GAMM|nr:fimbrial protein TcfA [Pantoea wallisii]ORM75205.1 hypothetical protein HA48_00310 [Pantoea wallisii]